MGKRFDKEFKIEAVRFASEPGKTQSGIARDFGNIQDVISRWKRELLKDGDLALPGKGCLKPDDDNLDDLGFQSVKIALLTE
jgi:transposase